MDISIVSDHFLLNTPVTSPAEIQLAAPTTVDPNKNQHDFFIASMHHYLKQLHQIVVESWGRFSESQKEISKKKESDAKTHDKRHTEDEARRLEGQKRHIEAQLDTYGSELINCGIHRQAGKFRFFQGQHHEWGRHLHLPV